MNINNNNNSNNDNSCNYDNSNNNTSAITTIIEVEGDPGLVLVRVEEDPGLVGLVQQGVEAILQVLGLRVCYVVLSFV